MAKLFKEQPVSTLFNQKHLDITYVVSKLNESILENDLETEALKIAALHSLKELVVDFEKDREVRVELVSLPGHSFPMDYDVRRDKTYPCAKAIFTFNVTSGNAAHITLQPRGYAFQANVNVDILNKYKAFEIGYQTLYSKVQLSNEAQNKVKNGMSEIIEEAKNALSVLNQNIRDFNLSLASSTLDLLKKRKLEIEKFNKIKNNLNDF